MVRIKLKLVSSTFNPGRYSYSHFPMGYMRKPFVNGSTNDQQGWTHEFLAENVNRELSDERASIEDL